MSKSTKKIGDALPKNCIPVNTKEKDISKLSHGDYVNRCLMVVLNHGYQVRMQGTKVEYNESESQLEYKPEQPLIDSLKKSEYQWSNGGFNPGYPHPWNLVPNNLYGMPHICIYCKENLGSDVLMCEIDGCDFRFTCNKPSCAYKHYTNKHARI